MYCPFAPSFVCQQTCSAPQSSTWPKDLIRFFDAASSFFPKPLIQIRERFVIPTYLLREDQSVLKNPSSFQRGFHSPVVRRSIDLSCGLSQSQKSAFNLHVGVRTVCHRCVLQKFGKKQRILADPLDWLKVHQHHVWSRLEHIADLDKEISNSQ